ncbi:MAG: hypothetical protein BGO25_18550 [Acidobacteriales bacterium 59-55]|nr:carboxypeptidase regulatory-like domain-containing protein [Terriglobales bacterium]OJV42142.1 MAG: hypothetical protein BGO25_18550 [Acidobacteriales bacterium 59-55]
MAGIATLFVAFTGLALAESITGTVTNKTTNKPAAGDDVVLIRLAQGMQEASRTKTDSHGRFTLDVPDAGMHLVRVTHDKAAYFRPAPPGTESVEVDVYNAAEKVAGVTAEADVMRVQTDESGKRLNIVENFFIKNASDPPKTQFSPKSFEFFLPDGAVIEGSAALAPGSMPVKASPMPLGDPNHYAFVFPIRPGETRFQVTYHLPYSGSFKFTPRMTMPTDTVAIMMPKSMTFTAGPSTDYSPVTEEMTAQTYVARSVAPSQQLDFTLSGSGQLPRDTQAAATSGQGQTTGGPESSAAADTRPGGGLGNPIDPTGNDDPWAKYKWWILGALGLAMAAGGGIMLKGTPAKSTSARATATVPPGPNAALAALKEELFSLEADKLQGRVTDAEYAEQKAALEVVLRRALQRSEPAAEASNMTGPVA